MNAGQVEALLILGGNPVYTAPADLDFADERCKKVAVQAPPRHVPGRDRRCCATGTSTRPTTSKRGATSAGTTAPRRSSSRSSRRCYDGKSAIEFLADVTAARPRRAGRPRPRRSGEGDVAQKRFADGDEAPATFEPFWQESVRAASSPARRPRPRAGRARGNWAADAPPAPPAPPAERVRDQLPPRPDALRRPVRQQRLAPGTAQADHQADLGQRRVHQPERRPTKLGVETELPLDRRRTRPGRGAASSS